MEVLRWLEMRMVVVTILGVVVVVVRLGILMALGVIVDEGRRRQRRVMEVCWFCLELLVIISTPVAVLVLPLVFDVALVAAVQGLEVVVVVMSRKVMVVVVQRRVRRQRRDHLCGDGGCRRRRRRRSCGSSGHGGG